MYCVLRTNHAKFAKETSAIFRKIQHWKVHTFFGTEYISTLDNVADKIVTRIEGGGMQAIVFPGLLINPDILQ